ncbi:outer dynein arm-docking complex subunit 3 isoform X2 [Phascolarctos cinereus]
MVPLHSPAASPFPKTRSFRSFRSISSRPASKHHAKQMQSHPHFSHSGVKPPVHVQISELHKKIQLLEGERKCFYESTQWTIKKNKETIKHLREENKISYQKLSDLFSGDEKVLHWVISEWKEEKPYLKNKNGEEALALVDHRLNEKMKQLNALRHEAEQRQQRIEELQLQYSLRELEINEFQDSDTEVAKTMRNLENRLEKARLKANEAEHITRVYLQLKAYMQEESLNFENKLDAMEGEVSRLRHEFSELQNVGQQATDARDAAKSELQKLEENLFKDRKERDRVLMEARKRTEEKKLQNERIERKTQQRDQVPTRSDETLTDAQGTKPDKLKHQWNKYQTELACDRLRVATGVSDPSFVVSRFLAQSETFAHLESLKQENEVTLAALKQDKQRLQQELTRLKYSGEAKAIRDNQVMVELQKHLDTQEKQIAEAKEKLQNTIVALQLAKDGVEHLAEKLKHIPVEKSKKELNPNTVDYVLDLMAQNEEKLLKLQSEMEGRNVPDLLQQLAEREFYATLEGKLPSHNTRIFVPTSATQDNFFAL